MRVRRLLAALGALPVLGLLTAPPAAVGCTSTVLPGTLIDPDASAVFLGTAVRLDDPRGPFDMTFGSSDAMAWTFQVDDVQKGSGPDRVTVYSERTEASCGYEFQLGGRYLVVASGPSDSLHVGMAGGTRPIEPLAEPPAVEHAEARLFMPVVVVGGAVLAVGVVAYLAFTRDSSPRERPRPTA